MTLHSDKIRRMSTSPGSHAVGVVLAAGMGTRVGADGNKAYLRWPVAPWCRWSLEAVTGLPGIARTVLVFRRGESELAQDTVRARTTRSATVEFVEGGDSRHASEFNVLRYLAADIESGLDRRRADPRRRPAAGRPRPCSSPRCPSPVSSAAPIPAMPVPDVVATGTVRLRVAAAGQHARSRPDARRRSARHRCCRRIAPPTVTGFEGTDTSSCVETFTDVEVRTFAGDERNLKVTYAHDIAVAERLLTAARSPCRHAMIASTNAVSRGRSATNASGSPVDHGDRHAGAHALLEFVELARR